MKHMQRKARSIQEKARSVQEWMAYTGTTLDQLAKMSAINASHLSKILSGSRRCSLEKAGRLAAVTEVPVEKLVQWFVHDRQSENKGAA